MTKVLFVCLGNICRSPMAEGLMKAYAQEKGIDLMVDSAGTGQWNLGQPPHEGTQKILKEAGVDSTGMVARLIQDTDFETFDYIIGMDLQNVADLQRLSPKKSQDKIFNYLSVVPGKEQASVPDPWYTGDFEETYTLIKEGLPGWLTRFQANQ